MLQQNLQINKKFYQKLPKFLAKENNTILAGNFNIIEDIFLHQKKSNTSNTHLIGLNKVIEIKMDINVVHIWRKITPIKETLLVTLTKLYIVD